MEPTEYFALHANMHGQDHSLTEVNKVSLLDPSLPLSGKQKEQTRGRMILRLKIYSLIDGGRANCNNGSLGFCKTLTDVYLLQPSKGLGRRRLHLRVRRSALKDEKNGGGNNGGSLGKNWDPGLEIEVPFEQRPVNEYSSLKDGVLYSWAELSPGLFFLRLGGLWLVAFAVLGAPVSSASFDPSRETLKFLLAAGTGPLFLVSLVVLRIYLGWSYVGDRLLSAVIPYEESGWYDGQMWVKPPEVLARDRLLGSYKVKPVIKMLKQTLLSTGALLVTLVSLFIFADQVQDLVHASVMINGDNSSSVRNPTSKNSLRREELLSLPVEVINDDDLAAAAAEAADGRPVYCRDRFYRALAGGQYCKWEDLLK